MVDLEGDHPHAVLLVDQAIVGELLHFDGNALRRELLVGNADLDVGPVGFFQIRHQVFCAGRADDAERLRSPGILGMQPTGQPHVGNAAGVVGVIMRQQQRIDSADRNSDLKKPDGRAAPGIDEQLLLAGLDERARPETVGAWRRHAGSEERHPEIA